MTGTKPTAPSPRPPVLIAGMRRALMLGADGAARMMSHGEAIEALAAGARPIVCHLPSVARRLGTGPFPAY